MLTCKEVTELTSDYIDDELPRGARLRIRFHFWMCRACGRYLQEMRRVTHLSAAVSTRRSLPSNWSALRDAYRHRHDDQDKHNNSDNSL